jgi:phosphohistidine phosphatase SixA
MSSMTRILAALLTLLVGQVHAAELSGEALLTELKKGGYTLLVRHARTDRSIPVRETPGGPVPALRSDQRNLTADGEADVRLMRAVVEAQKLPIGDVISSPLYRCRETADAFGTPTVTMALRVFPTTPETLAIVTAVPKPGTNHVLVTHHFVMETLVPGIAPGDIDESEAAVIRAEGNGKLQLVGKIKREDWQRFAGTAKSNEPTPQPPSAYVHAWPASSSGGAVTIPDSAIGRLASGYLAAFNSGDVAKMRAFVESSLVANPERPISARIESYTRLFAEHGALTLESVPTVADDKVSLLVQSKRGKLLVTVMASADPQRAQSVTLGLLHGGGGH